MALVVGATLLAALAAAPAAAHAPTGSGTAGDGIAAQGVPASLGRLLGETAARPAGISPARDAALLEAHGAVARVTPRGTQVAVSLTVATEQMSVVRASIRRLGGDVVNELGSVLEAYVPPAALGELRRTEGVRMVMPILRPLEMLAQNPGVTLQGGTAWQAAGLAGTGVKVGVIDGGFAGISALLGNGLPATVHARCYVAIGSYTSDVTDCENGVSHGTAVTETIAAMAPRASLYVADPTSWADEMQTVRWMTSNGVRIINASWVSPVLFEGPGNGTSPFAQSSYAVVDAATAGGALWVNAAGNSGDDGWSGAWADTNGNGWLDFSGSTESDQVTLAAGQELAVAMRWDEPWGSASADYVLDVFQPGGTSPIASSTDLPVPPQYPYGIVDFTAPRAGNYDIRVWHIPGTPTPRLQLLGWSESPTQMQITTTSDTLASPADSANPAMLTVGAVRPPDGAQIEPYSSRGPTVDGRVKPDLVAVDCIDTVSEPEFCGTSESTPYVSGAAALVLQAHPSFTPAQLATYLKSHAVPLGTPVPNSVYGAGRLDLGPVPGTATGVRFGSQPLGAAAGAPFEIQPTVQLVDGEGGPATAPPSGATTATLSLGANPSDGTLQCSGGLTASFVHGVATFSGCSIDQPGSGYTLTASVKGLAPATSAPLTISQAGASAPDISLHASASVITWATGVSLTAQLASGPGGAALAARPVELQATRDHVTWFPIAELTTDAQGSATFVYRPPTNLYYRAVYTGTPDMVAAASQVSRVVVRQIALLRPTSAGALRQVAPGTRITFSTTVRPDRPELPPPTVTYRVERWSGSAWVMVEQRTTLADASGIARFTWTFSSAGYYYVRSVAVPTPYNANSVWSSVERYLVR